MSENTKISRVPVGISGLDRLIEGGIPQGFNVIVAGNPGTGKSIFCQRFLYNGSIKKEPSIFISLDETKENIVRQASLFGWDFEKLEKENMIRIEHLKLSNIDETLKNIESLVSEIKAKRLVIDSITSLFELSSMYEEIYQRIYENKPSSPYISQLSEQGEVKKNMYRIFNKLKMLKCTTLCTSEAVFGSDKLTRDGISEFICDGLIHLNYVPIGQSSTRTLEVKKMRQTNIVGGVHFFKFTDSGISIESNSKNIK